MIFEKKNFDRAQQLALCTFIAAVCLQFGCTDATPVEGGLFFTTPNWPYEITFDTGMNAYERLLNHSKVDTLWGMLTANIYVVPDSTQEMELELQGNFRVDARGPLRSLAFNSVNVPRNITPLKTNSVPLNSGAYYELRSHVDSASNFNSPIAHWLLTSPIGEIIDDTIAFPKPLNPVTTSDILDTISAGNPLRLTWSNAQPGDTILIELENVSDSSGTHPQIYLVPDNGSFVVPADSIAGRSWSFLTDSSMFIHFVRGYYNHTTTYDNGAKRLGNFIYTDTYAGVYIKP